MKVSVYIQMEFGDARKGFEDLRMEFGDPHQGSEILARASESCAHAKWKKAPNSN